MTFELALVVVPLAGFILWYALKPVPIEERYQMLIRSWGRRIVLRTDPSTGQVKGYDSGPSKRRKLLKQLEVEYGADAVREFEQRLPQLKKIKFKG